MERIPSFTALSSRSSSRASLNRLVEPLLPYAIISEKTTPKLRMRGLLGNCLYRRVLLWAVAFLSLGILVVIGSHRRGFSLDWIRNNAPTANADVLMENGEAVVLVTVDLDDEKKEVSTEEEDVVDDQEKQWAEALQRTPWLRFPELSGYFNGVKTIVNKTDLVPEYPNITTTAPLPPPTPNSEAPKPTPYSPYNDTDSAVRTCYLDTNGRIPAPDIYAYNGVPQHMPDPALGSYELLGIRDDICFDRFSRYGPYGLGYGKTHGGSDVGLDTESSGNEAVWTETGQIDYSNMDWGSAQDRCYEANKARFRQLNPITDELQETEGKKGRIAVVVRTYTGFQWTDHAILNFRAMINELSLRSGSEYTVHFLMQVRDTDAPIFADERTAQQIIAMNIPSEFRNMVTLWSESEMKLIYPGKFEDPIVNPSGGDIHGIYRSAHFPLQVFAMQHPEYEHFWNWEMDMRYLGSYYEFFDRVGRWADEQPRPLIWERNAKYYIPSYHGSWQNFTRTVQLDTIRSSHQTVFSPLDFEGKQKLRAEEEGRSTLPLSCSSTADKRTCGVGEPADLITLNPIFDTAWSGWVFTNDATGYSSPPPRRCAIITASRLSYRLLSAMHEEVWRHHHSMFSEMFPPSVALHHGFKAVYAPHPVYLERAWYPFSEIDGAFNGGRDHSTSGEGSPFDLRNEHNHRGTSWYYNSEFAGGLWRRWLGYGGSEEGSGRMCLRGMLVHPVKYEHPLER